MLARQPESKLLIQLGTFCPQPHVSTAWLTFLSFGPGSLWLVPSTLPTKQQPQLHPHGLNQLYITYDPCGKCYTHSGHIAMSGDL